MCVALGFKPPTKIGRIYFVPQNQLEAEFLSTWQEDESDMEFVEDLGDEDEEWEDIDNKARFCRRF